MPDFQSAMSICDVKMSRESAGKCEPVLRGLNANFVIHPIWWTDRSRIFFLNLKWIWYLI